MHTYENEFNRSLQHPALETLFETKIHDRIQEWERKRNDVIGFVAQLRHFLECFTFILLIFFVLILKIPLSPENMVAYVTETYLMHQVFVKHYIWDNGDQMLYKKKYARESYVSLSLGKNITFSGLIWAMDYGFWNGLLHSAGLTCAF